MFPNIIASIDTAIHFTKDIDDTDTDTFTKILQKLQAILFIGDTLPVAMYR